MYNIYDLNQAHNDFVKRFGIEPNGVLMNNYTLESIKGMCNTPTDKMDNNVKLTIMGAPIFISEEMSNNKLRFII